ncbi:MAG: type II pantothenate kinase [Papillibacter sp.]|nr:type II pantothenate kinase [Papillibacter sp.]
MKAVLGIDLGGSTTKIAGLAPDGALIGVLQIKASDQITSVYGAIGNFLQTYRLELKDVTKIILTGVGASFITENIYCIPTYRMVEFKAVGHGGCKLAGLDKALVVSMGTGTAFIRVSGNDLKHLGGSGIGGGTLVGLSVGLINENDISKVAMLAENGDSNNVDLTIQDISKNTIPNLPPYATAANLGKMKHNPAKADVAIGLINLIFQVIGMMAVFACEGSPIKDIILTGTLTTLKQAQSVFDAVGRLHGLNFIIPENAVFAGAIGAAAADDSDLSLI